MFRKSLILPVDLYFLGLLISWMIHDFRNLKKPDLDEAGIILRDYNKAWDQYKKTKSDEDHQKYLDKKEVYEIGKDLEKEIAIYLLCTLNMI